MANLNINQFAQVPVRGEVDLQLSKSGVVSGVISANQATALKAGDFVIIDAAVTTSGNFLQWKASATSSVGLVGCIIHDVKKDSYVAGDVVQVALNVSGPVVYLKAAATIAPGAAVEDDGSSQVQTLSSGKLRGYAIEPGTTGNLLRIMTFSALS